MKVLELDNSICWKFLHTQLLCIKNVIEKYFLSMALKFIKCFTKCKKTGKKDKLACSEIIITLPCT